MREPWRLFTALLLATVPVAREALAAADAIAAVAGQSGGGLDVTVSFDDATMRALVDGARWTGSSLLAYLIGRSQPIPKWPWMRPQPAPALEDAEKAEDGKP